MWEVEYSDDFGKWWDTLTESEQVDVAACVGMLEVYGPNLRFPYSSDIKGAKHTHMRELRVQHKGKPYRILYAFDPRRIAILLIGGDKTSDNKWYERFVLVADNLYTEHLINLKHESLIDA